jgi:hypothetical protein
VSELSTNAIRHTASGWEPGSFHLAVAVSAQVVAVSVTDDGGAATAPEVGHQDQAPVALRSARRAPGSAVRCAPASGPLRARCAHAHPHVDRAGGHESITA